MFSPLLFKGNNILLITILKFSIASAIITLSSWLAGKRPDLAGFIIALPVASLIALAFSFAEHRDAEASITFAKSILIGVPVSWLFFAPFFLAERLNLGFVTCYVAGLILLTGGFFLHQYIMKFI